MKENIFKHILFCFCLVVMLITSIMKNTELLVCFSTFAIIAKLDLMEDMVVKINELK